MNENKAKRGSDAIGLVLFCLGAFFLVLSVLALYKGLPATSGRGSLALAQSFVGAIGAVPGLILSGGVAVVGAMLFLGAEIKQPRRWVTGAAALALGFSVLLGSLGSGGGRLGAATGGMLADKTNVALGAFVGAVSLGLVAWFLFVRGRLQKSGKAVQTGRVPAVLMREPLGGVTNAEAEALVPKAATNLRAAREELAQAMENLRQVSTPLPPTYPEDVRLKGEIPAGAKPLETDESPREQGAPESGLRQERSSAEALVAESPADDLAQQAAAPGEWIRTSGRPESEPSSPVNVEAGREGSAAQPLTEVTPEATRAALRPSWEAPDEDEAPIEPVDAYGTPMTVVESQTGRRSAGRVESVDEESEAPQSAEQEELVARADTPEEDPVADVGAAYEEEALAEDEEYEEEDSEEVHAEDEEYEEEEEEEEEPEEALAEDEEYEEEDSEEVHAEDEEYEEEEEEEEPEEALAEDEEYEEEDSEEVYAEGEEYEEEEEEEEPEEALAEDEEYEEEDSEEVHAEGEEYEEEEEEEEEPEEALAEDEEYEEEDSEELYAEGDEPESEEVQPVAQAEADEQEDEPVPHPVTGSQSTEPEPKPERDVVLTPAAAPALESAPESSLTDELINDAGALFLEQGRVAVSMLQRKFSLGFDESCLVLDRLQDMGLIGPYRGGQRRDILMTEDQWVERVTAT